MFKIVPNFYGLMKLGLIIQTTGSKHIVLSDSIEFECTLKGRLRMRGIKSTNPVAVGDYVEFEQIDDRFGVIIRIKERKNCILRKSSKLSKSTHIIAANIDQVVIIFTLKYPVTTTVFLDRLLVATESYNISPLLVFNKSDLYSESEIKQIHDLIKTYKKIGYRTVLCSLKENKNINKLKAEVLNKVNVVVGHSGTGKTTLINTLEPNADLKIGTISDYHKSGKHITTFAKMIRISEGGHIIDTPGIRGFGIVDIKKEEIYHFFPEMFKTSTMCRYYNCTHTHEPDCAVVAGVESGDISILRYKSYLNMFLDEDDKHRQKDIGIF